MVGSFGWTIPHRLRSRERYGMPGRNRGVFFSRRIRRSDVLHLCVMERVGVRELRQNLSVYLRRVRRGESLEVTERGEPVAVLQPSPSTRDPLTALAARGVPVRRGR